MSSPVELSINSIYLWQTVFSLNAYNNISHPSCSSKMTLPFLHQRMTSNSHSPCTQPGLSDSRDHRILQKQCSGPPRLEYMRPGHFVWISCNIAAGTQLPWEKPKLLEKLCKYLLNSPSWQPASPASPQSEPSWTSRPTGLSDAHGPSQHPTVTPRDPKKIGPTEPSETTNHDR